MMRAFVCRQFGRPPELEELPVPRPRDNEVRVRVHAAAVNPADVLMIAGTYQERPSLPFVPGLEAAGEVVEVGRGVTSVAPGDRVIALCERGGFADEVVTRDCMVIRVPPAMDHERAAAFAVSYGTMETALSRRAMLRAGETLLVHGAAGAIGLAAIDLGRAAGATVIATARSADKLAAAQGAHHTLLQEESLDLPAAVKQLTSGRGADVIVDPVGGALFTQSLRSLAVDGRLVTVGFASGEVPQVPANLLLVKSVTVIGVYWGLYARRPGLEHLIRDSLARPLQLFASGQLRPEVGRRFDLAELPDALRSVAQGGSVGKTIVVRREPIAKI
jgi:NADPH:quinone reductase